MGSGTGVGSCRCGVRCRPQDPDQHGRHHHRGAGTDGGQLLPVPRPSQTALAAPAGGLCRHGCSPLPAGVRCVLTACRHPGRRHCAGRMDAGSLLPLLWRDHRLYDEPHQSGDRQAGGILAGSSGCSAGQCGREPEVQHQSAVFHQLQCRHAQGRAGEGPHHHLCDGRVLLGCLGAGTVRHHL